MTEKSEKHILRIQESAEGVSVTADGFHVWAPTREEALAAARNLLGTADASAPHRILRRRWRSGRFRR